MVPKRASITIRGLVHQRLKAYADAHGRSLSGLCEEFIADKLEQFPAVEPRPQPTPAVPKPVEDDDTARELGEPDEVVDVPPAVMYL